jgi:hypothetical protein
MGILTPIPNACRNLWSDGSSEGDSQCLTTDWEIIPQFLLILQAQIWGKYGNIP